MYNSNFFTYYNPALLKKQILFRLFVIKQQYGEYFVINERS
ncbi:hypothetical protein HMPREF9193_01985 [Treponema lecithinolyticum ATCC 700332]|uniref:Uncharacterized protein n=1 Tax=Treponema lecithinolyticum ATCC 700332 TaxID=1321815 RepID=A0ABN0NWV7_TRELE|nr:hypothetical protein HMPREF9193_01985 [Treponema lecithinolyticum ATCC 700332]